MTHPSRTLAALTGAAALTITGMSPASAADWDHDDAVGDVQSQTETFDGGRGRATAHPTTPTPTSPVSA